MNSSLLWKQWQENKRYLAIFMSWMILAICYSVAYEMGHRFRAIVGQFSGFALFYSICAAIFLAMRTAQGEREAGTLSFSASLPVSMRRIAAVRIGGAIATLAIPILVAAVLLSVALIVGLVEQAEPRGVAAYVRLPQRGTASLLTSLNQLWNVAAIAVLGGVELLLVISLLGCRLRNQAQVGFLGAVIGFGSIIASGLFWFGTRNPYYQLFYGALLPQSLVVQWGYGAENGSYTDHEITQYNWLSLGLAIPVLVILVRLFLFQYEAIRSSTSVTKPGRFRFAMPSILSYISFRFRGRLTSLVWLELRQSVPLALFGLVIAMMMAGAETLIEGNQSQSISDALLTGMPHSTGVVAILWAVVVGSSLYSAELGAGLGGFWRSRPISTGMWFWCKFIVGLIAVLSVLDGVTILISWNAPRETMTSGMSWAYIACFPIMHAFLYTLAVLGTCWLRRPVIGGFLAIVCFAVLTIAITSFQATRSLEPMNVFNALLFAERDGQIDFTQHGYPLVYGVLAVSILGLAVISSQLAKPLQPISRWFRPVAG